MKRFSSIEQWTASLILVLLICSAMGLLINHYFYQFPGNNYFPKDVLSAFIILIISFFCISIYFKRHHYLSELIQGFLQFFIVISMIALITNASQLTPFEPIDAWIIKAEQKLYIDLPKYVEWTFFHPFIYRGLNYLYESLAYEMILLPCLLLFLGYFHRFSEYCLLMLLTALIGFLFYYFFPTIAPASIFNLPYFSPSQFATGIKFHEIHHHLKPSTIEGGMIAMPSFHVIWAFLCLYLVRPLPYLFWVLLPFNLGVALACVLLGWHYVLDIIGSIIVIFLSFQLKNRFILKPIRF